MFMTKQQIAHMEIRDTARKALIEARKELVESFGFDPANVMMMDADLVWEAREAAYEHEYWMACQEDSGMYGADDWP